MKISSGLKSTITSIISYLYILLFTYAAVSKLLDYENFTVQLGQSPLLSAFAGWIAWTIPTIELLIVLLLMFACTRLIGMIAGLALMVMFTTYIFIMLHFSDFVPCSCGGILEKLSWNQHMVFNLCYCLLAIIAIIWAVQTLPEACRIKKPANLFIAFLSISTLAISAVTILFLTSEKIIHHENSFIRRFPPHLYDKSAELNLEFPGHYFAGANDSIIYLGNHTSPLTIVALHHNLKVKEKFRIQLDTYDLPFQSAQVRIAPPYFFLSDGTVPCIFRGKLSDWRGYQLHGINTYFTAMEPVDSITMLFRGKSLNTKESVLGIMNVSEDNYGIKYGEGLLQKQIDGIFDSDGMLHYNSNLHRLIYLYYYRNQFIVADKYLNLSFRGSTIDTTSRAKLKIATLENGDRKILGTPPVVNNYSSTSHNFLYVNSNLRGRFESESQWKETSVIDVYDLVKNTYKYSLPIYNVNKKKLHAMLATETHIYVLIENSIVAYRLINENLPRN